MKNTFTAFLLLLSFVAVTFAQETKQETTAKVNTTKSIESTTAATYDFTTGSNKFFGGTSGAVEVEANVWGMIAGDGNGNGQIQNNDSEDIWKPANGTSGYSDADFNLNGQVQNNDREDYWKLNNGKGSAVP